VRHPTVTHASRKDTKGLVDVQGPVAAQGNITADNFKLNWRQQEPTALVARGNITLGNITRKTGGTVWGSVLYGGTTFSDTPEVTYVNGTRPTTAYDDAIDFVDASSSLLNMSKQVALYDAIKPASPSNHTIKFTGSDSELNVFSIPSTALSGVTVFQFNVPTGSAVIINVTGKTVSFLNAGSTTSTGGSILTLNLQSVLWNFPDATTLTLTSTTILGSILAPKAATTVTYGAILGTVVAQSVNLNAEIDWSPYQVPSAGGCLSLDPSWSCSHDTAVVPKGITGLPPSAAAIKAEAGFLDIPLDNYTAEGQQRTSPEHRIWYAFQPASTTPTIKPLAVFFNGGPGSATSSLLFSFNTATMTLDPNNPNTTATGIAVNPNNWTQFANLLYIDAPTTGFSYPLGYHDSTGALQQPSIGIDISRDAGIFLQVLARFLIRHPALLGNQVILVAESYGGVRATLMLYNLYHYLSLNVTGSSYYDLQLYQDLISYLSLACPGQAPYLDLCIPSIFHHQIMIEPGVVGSTQLYYQGVDEVPQQQGCLSSNNAGKPCSSNGLASDHITVIPATCDIYNCDKDVGWQNGQEDIAAVRLNNVATLKTALGVDPTTILWMHSIYRQLAYGRNEGGCGNGTGSEVNAFSTQSMIGAFGALGSATDCYFIVLNDPVHDGYPGASDWEQAGDTVGYYFLGNIQNKVASFITVAQYDQEIWTPAIAQALYDLADPNDPNNPSSPNPNADPDIENLVSNVYYNPIYQTSVSARRGSMAITYKSLATPVQVTMPTSYPSGHSVTIRDPNDLLTDVMQWYAAN